jgi:hypothetical protein
MHRYGTTYRLNQFLEKKFFFDFFRPTGGTKVTQKSGEKIFFPNFVANTLE